jgi:type II secretory pathway component GspD/PulD (secretin)
LQTTGDVTITPDVRLNLLIVQANATDMDLIDQLVTIIDQDRAPQIPETAGKTYIIPIYFMAASDMANVVKQAFPENIIGAGSSAQGRQPSPQEFIRAIAGRGQGRGSSGGRDAGEERKMALGVDEHSNSLVITGPEHLYKQVLSLVERLDRAGVNSTETVSVISLNGSINPQALKKSLDSILGEQVKTSTTSTSQPSQPSTGQPSSQPSMDQFRQRMEMFRALQQRYSDENRPSAGPGGGRTGRPSGGVPGGGTPGSFRRPGIRGR